MMILVTRKWLLKRMVKLLQIFHRDTFSKPHKVL